MGNEAKTPRRRFSSLDAVFTQFETDVAPMHIGSVNVYEGAIPFRRFVRDIESKLHLIPRYLQVMREAPFRIEYPSWEPAPKLDLEHHVYLHTLPKPGSEIQLRRLAERILSRKLDRSRPLWDLHVVHGLEGRRSAVITRVHHCLADGISGVELAKIMFDHSPVSGAEKSAPAAEVVEPETPRALSDALWDLATDEVARWTEIQQCAARFVESLKLDRARETTTEILGLLRGLTGRIDRFPFNVHRLSGKKRLAWTEFSFAEVRKTREALEGTVNDVVLSTLGIAMRDYLRAHRQKTAGRSLVVMVPVSLRHEHERGMMGNRVSMLPARIPLDEPDPIELFRVVSGHMRRLKDAHIADALFAILRAAQFSPMLQAGLGRLAQYPAAVSLLTMISAYPIVNTVCTNVPGPNIPLYTVGRRMVSYYPYLPVAAEVGVTFGVLSYNQKLAITIVADSAAMKDSDRMREHLESAFIQLRSAAGVVEREPIAVHPARKSRPRTKLSHRQ